MELLSPKEKQQNLFDQANAKLNESFYRHSTDVLENTQNLAKFKDSLCAVPPLPQRETKLYKVEEVKHVRIGRKHWYSLKKKKLLTTLMLLYSKMNSLLVNGITLKMHMIKQMH